MTQQSIEDRLAAIERKIAELEAERAQLRALSTMQARQTELRDMFDGLREYMADRLQTFEEHVNLRLDLAEDHDVEQFRELKEGQAELRAGQAGLQVSVQGLQAGQEQILAILTRRLKTND